MSTAEPAPAIDHRAIAWRDVIAARYTIDQTLRYEYAEPIRNLRHRLIIAPRRRHHDQQRLDHAIWASTSGALPLAIDAFGNEVASVSVDHVPREITFGLASTIERDRRRGANGASDADAGRDWREPGRLTRPDAALCDAAADVRRAYPDRRERAEAIAHFVYAHMTFTKNVTDVATTAADAFALRRGVCQDYAHVTVALARACGIGARYASGHLLGEGATHAWVEFVLDEAGDCVRSFDPTYGSATDLRYVVVAIGRDYDDVSPTSGTFTGSGSGQLYGRQCVRLTDVTYRA
jgi:transglutaminase-like putative cysteine protease